MKTPRFSGPFKWSAVRQQLLSLREDIQSIQKIAGRNVTIDEHRGKGKVINVNRGEQATSPPEITCELPTVDGAICPHSLCFDLKIEQAEIDDDFAGDVIDFLGSGRGASDPLMGLFPQYGSNLWGFFSDAGEVDITTETPAGEWFPVKIELWTEGSVPKMKFTLNGVESATGDATSADITGLLVGANLFSTSRDHRSIRNVQLIANPSSAEEDFIFPPDSFDSVTGSAITISGGVITIDGTGFNYAIKNLDPAYGVCTDCGEGVPTDDTPSVTVEISGVTSCGCVCTNPIAGDLDCSDPERTHQSVIVTPAFDGLYTLPFREDLDGPIFELIDDTAAVGSVDFYDISVDCTECSGEECPETIDLVGIRLMVHYNTLDGLWTFFCDVGGGTANPKTFEAIGLITDCWGNGGTTHNQVGCSGALGVFGTGAMTGGDITLTWE